MIKLSRGQSVGLCVGLSNALWKNGGSHPDAVWPRGVVGRAGPLMRQVVGFEDRSPGRGTFGGEFGARHCNQWGLYGVRCATVPRRGPLPKLFWTDLLILIMRRAHCHA